jgi:hypothetical protein
MKFNKKKYIENMLIERSHAMIFPDIKCKNPKMKPKLDNYKVHTKLPYSQFFPKSCRGYRKTVLRMTNFKAVFYYFLRDKEGAAIECQYLATFNINQQ